MNRYRLSITVATETEIHPARFGQTFEHIAKLLDDGALSGRFRMTPDDVKEGEATAEDMVVEFEAETLEMTVDGR